MKTETLLIIRSEGLIGRSIQLKAKKKFKKIICIDLLKSKKKIISKTIQKI